MSGPFVRAGQSGNASFTWAANNQTNLLDGAGRLLAPASASEPLTPLVIRNLQVL